MLRRERAAIETGHAGRRLRRSAWPSCRGREIPIAILTRNVREVVETFARMFTSHFHAVYTREDGPPKPSPEGALSLCRGDGRGAVGTLAVGGSEYIVIAGRDAGCRTVLVDREGLAAHELVEWGARIWW